MDVTGEQRAIHDKISTLVEAPVLTQKRNWSISDPSCSSSELATTHSSAPPPYDTKAQATGNRIDPVLDRSGDSYNVENTSVFELLQSQSIPEEVDTAVDDITSWVDQLEVSIGEERKEKLARVLSSIDGFFAPGNEHDQKQCPADRSHGSAKEQESKRSVPFPKGPSTCRKKVAKSKASQPSLYESEASHAPSNPQPDSTWPFANMLACPFTKHDRQRYSLVANSCTERFGFPNPGKLVEHLKRVHSLRVPCCITCKQRFYGKTREKAEQAEQLHRNNASCQPRDITPLEPEWMTEEQDARFASSTIQGQNLSPEEKWRRLYRQLFNVQEHEPVPHPDYDFLVPSHSSLNGPSAPITQYHNLTANLAPELMGEMSPANDTSLHSGIDAVTPVNDILRQSASPQLYPAGALSLASTIETRVNTAAESTVPLAESFLTAALLNLNERMQPEVSFPYGVYQSQDSGYASLEQPPGPEAGEPLDFTEFIHTAPEDCEPSRLAEHDGP
ncbi:hypothetical protein K458DRAFT_393370 [Lentithecium fluviatile CBS 122367]|uniref:C2H2-type domain-containing protein n=1 Tax=Lentithecium fluviatile CBS 122367 TaxID=1168545 RepID=A0A6G1IPS2_9PLEO|nr:hypothetical protein K458DRAFT_393370 [Lentithecium fluviatile CBS 122367]